MTEEVRRYLRKAEHALEVAEDLLKGKHAPDAASVAADFQQAIEIFLKQLTH